MKFGGMALVAGLVLTINTMANNKVIYGEDDRLDITEITDKRVTDFTKATGTQISNKYLFNLGENVHIKYASLSRVMGVCEDERFAKQNAIGRCSGFLVSRDTLVTAGHCVQDQDDCEKHSWVFDYESSRGNKVPSSSVYRCQSILKSELNPKLKVDYAVIKLNREVQDRAPFTVRKSGKVELDTPLLIVGNPSGLPTKVTENAYVIENDHKKYFKTNADTFGGSSGSVVLNADTGLVEGVLVRGAKDYRFDFESMCRRVNVCQGVDFENGCFGESVMRITQIELEELLK